MTPGRKPKPTHLKLITGNPGRRPLKKNEPKPKPTTRLPPVPPFLGVYGSEHWKEKTAELFELGLLTPLDYGPLALLCLAWDRVLECQRAINEMSKVDMLTKGLMIKTTNGNALQNPLVGISNKAINEYLRIATEFGMTPSARSRIEAHKLAETKEADGTEEDGDPSSFFR